MFIYKSGLQHLVPFCIVYTFSYFSSNMDVVEDEWHFLLECPIYNAIRNKYAAIFDIINLAHCHNNLALTLSDADACVHTIMNHHVRESECDIGSDSDA